MKIRPYSSSILGAYSLIIVGIGLFFVLIRPPFLPEDVKYAGATIQEIQAIAPNITQWLNRVFTVMGGFIIATGTLTLYIACTSFRNRSKGVGIAIALASLSSIGLMVINNVLLNSDFKWPLIALALLWVSALILYMRGK